MEFIVTVSGVLCPLSEQGIKAYTVLEVPGLLVPDIEFGIGNGISGLPGMAFYPESVLGKITSNEKSIQRAEA